MATRNTFTGYGFDTPDDSEFDPTMVMNMPLPSMPSMPMDGGDAAPPVASNKSSGFLPGDNVTSTTLPAPAPATADPSLLGPNFSGPLPASFGGPATSADQVPVPSVNPGVVYTDASGRGYTPDELYANRNTLLQDPANARIRDILPQYGYGAAAAASSSGGGRSAQQLSSPGFSSSAGFSLPESALGDTVDHGLSDLIGNHGMTPEQTSLLSSINKIIAGGGALPQDDQLEAQQLESARENEAHAFGAQLNDARDELASRGLVGEPGIPQGSEGEAISNITRQTAPAYAQAVRDVSSKQIDTQNTRLISALSSATGITGDAARNLVATLGEGSDRQVKLAGIALDSLSQNMQWNEFLANYGLNRDQVLYSIQNGNSSALMTLISLFEQTAGLSAKGHV